MSFSVVCADPPWSFGDKLPGKGRGAVKHYRVMKTDEICNLVLPPIADDALLFLWRVSSQPEEACRVARAWGFVPKSEIVWVKISKQILVKDLLFPRGSTSALLAQHLPLHFGMGRYVRNSHESCLIASRGKGRLLIKSHAVRSIFFAPASKHSAKPEGFYSIVETLSQGPYLELFSRGSRPGWTCLGDQADEPVLPSDWDSAEEESLPSRWDEV